MIMKKRLWALTCVTVLWTSAAHPGAEPAAAPYRVAEMIEVDKVPSWFPVGFGLLTHGAKQYVAYYDEKHRMMVACRRIGDRKWQKVELPSKVGWDSHNYITLAVDAEGCLHLSGNMHCVPLIYFRTREPGDIATFERLRMTGQEEQRCTYPRFLKGAGGDLLFTYRSGGSGNGRRFYNRYSVETRTWSRFLDTPLFEGEGKRNAYPHGPVRGPDGLFHVVWVWRDTPDCATNHHLSYARSRDLKSWETAGGKPVSLPFTLGQSELCIDPIPTGGGIINGCERLAFDSKKRPIVSYHKLDANGHMQIYVTRFRNGRWERHPITTWDKDITFGGRGAMPFIGIKIGGLRKHEPALFSIKYRHRDYGSGRVFLDEDTLRPVKRDLRDIKVPSEYPRELTRPTLAFAGIGVRIAPDLGEPAEADPDAKYVLRWETLEAHHDRPRKPPLPPASVLKLVKLERAR
jgi:hypothetical protein